MLKWFIGRLPWLSQDAIKRLSCLSWELLQISFSYGIISALFYQWKNRLALWNIKLNLWSLQVIWPPWKVRCVGVYHSNREHCKHLYITESDRFMISVQSQQSDKSSLLQIWIWMNQIKTGSAHLVTVGLDQEPTWNTQWVNNSVLH